MAVQRHGVGMAGERADQHHQGAFGQVKVGNQQVNDGKGIKALNMLLNL